MAVNIFRLLIIVSALIPGAIAQAAVSVALRIVVRFETRPAVEAAWTPDERYVVTGPGVTRTFAVSNTPIDIVIDCATVPALSAKSYDEFARFTALTTTWLRYIQEPSLFSFTVAPKPVVLRQVKP